MQRTAFGKIRPSTEWFVLKRAPFLRTSYVKLNFSDAPRVHRWPSYGCLLLGGSTFRSKSVANAITSPLSFTFTFRPGVTKKINVRADPSSGAWTTEKTTNCNLDKLTARALITGAADLVKFRQDINRAPKGHQRARAVKRDRRLLLGALLRISLSSSIGAQRALHEIITNKLTSLKQTLARTHCRSFVLCSMRSLLTHNDVVEFTKVY